MSETPLRIGFVGDCLCAQYFFTVAQREESLLCDRRRFQSFEPFLSFDRSAFDSETGRFAHPDLNRFVADHHFTFPPQHQLEPDTISPKPELVVTSLCGEGIKYVYRHVSGVALVLNERNYLANRRISNQPYHQNFHKEPLFREQLFERTLRGTALLAQAYHPAPIIVMLQPLRSVGLVQSLFYLHGIYDYLYEHPDDYRAMLHTLCRKNENLVFIELDRVVIDGVNHKGLAPEYYFPHVTNTTIQHQMSKRNFTHAHDCLYRELIAPIKTFASERKIYEHEGLRFIQPPVTDEELTLAAQKLPIILSDEQIRRMIVEGDDADFTYALTQAKHRDDGRFNQIIADRLNNDERTWSDALLRNTMLDYIKKHAQPMFLPYLTVLWEDYIGEIRREAYLLDDWIFIQLQALRARIFENCGWTERRPEIFPNLEKQPEYWRQLDKFLGFHRARRIAIFPAGQHTRRLLPFLRETGRYEIVALLDEAAGEGAEIDGIPILPPDRLTQLHPDAVVVSSDSIEEKLYRQFVDRYRADPDLPVLKIYN